MRKWIFCTLVVFGLAGGGALRLPPPTVLAIGTACGSVTAPTLLSYGLDGAVGPDQLQILPQGTRSVFHLLAPREPNGPGREYTGHLLIRDQSARRVVLAAM